MSVVSTSPAASLKKHPLASPHRRAKIVCTIGPASRTPEVIGHLIDEGMNVARLNFSHGSADDHRRTVEAVRAEAHKRGKAVAILQDLQGPKIRVGKIKTGTVLEAGTEFILTTEEILGDANRASVTYEGLPRDAQPGNVLLLDDGLLQVEVLSIEGNEVVTRVLVGGPLSNNKGINLPGVKVSAPSMSDKDHADLIVGQKLGVDFLALSFVRSAQDIHDARAAILAARKDIPESQSRPPTPIIAKIEKPEAVDRLEEIIEAADGIMVARGDLGVELGPEKVPLVQKAAIQLANAHAKLVITATQMLESMTQNARPTRAEASDVANAVMDASDALMLSAESASGKYPLLAVRTMDRIIREVEQSERYFTIMRQLEWPMIRVTSNAVAHAAVVASRLVEAPVIVALSNSGGAARLLSEYRSEALVVGMTSSVDIYNQLAAYWGILPMMAPQAEDETTMIRAVLSLVRDRGLAKPGQHVILTMAIPFRSGLPTNTMQIHRVE
ncbi:MAG TPA: pyruvate kinase [Pseudomonadota bacterium]|nr:pyruvate kinase [Pseudomonadota bacterium]